MNLILFQDKFKDILILRGITFEYYIQKLAEGSTNGLEMAILTLCEIFGISIIILCENFLWKSEEKSLDDFHMYFVMFRGGRIMSATRHDNHKFLLQMPHELKSLINAMLSTDGVASAAPSYQIPVKRKRGCPKNRIRTQL